MPLIYGKTVLAMGRDISEVYGSLLRKKLCTRSIRPFGLVVSPSMYDVHSTNSTLGGNVGLKLKVT
jgi:hypothetical protein